MFKFIGYIEVRYIQITQLWLMTLWIFYSFRMRQLLGVTMLESI